MDFSVEFLNYGRHGILAKEPRTGLEASGETQQEVEEIMKCLLREYMNLDCIPPDDGPSRSIRIISI